VAAIIAAEQAGTGAAGALEGLRAAEYDISDTLYPAFIQRYFAGRRPAES
jgi:hypothetical protein